MSIAINNETSLALKEGFLEEYAQLAAYVLAQEGVSASALLSISLVDEDEIAALNGEYRNKEGSTDVLSFPCDDFGESSSEEPVLLGDIVVSPAVAERQNDDVYAELRLLLVHGILHLIGYDHVECESQAETMEAREQELLQDWVELMLGDPSWGACRGGCCG